MQIILETLYTPYTLDTYSTFTMEGEEDWILESLNENRADDLEPLEYKDIDWTYDTAGYLNDLAENLIILLKDNILDDVIIDLKQDGAVESPRYYNYTTDCAWIDFTVDENNLKKYISENTEDYNANKIKSTDGFWWNGDESQTMLAYYLEKVSANDDKYPSNHYLMDQMDCISPYEYIEFNIINE